MNHVNEFVEALKRADNKRMKSLIDQQPGLANQRNEDGISLLMLSMYYRNGEIQQCLLGRKRELDLFEAAASGQLPRLSEILSESAGEINSFSPDGFTAAGLASYFGQAGALDYLISGGADINLASENDFKVCPIHSAAATGDISVASLLLKAGADVNARQMKGITALHSAAHNGNMDMARLLVEAGAEINTQAKDGKTPFEMALESGHEDVANYLQRMSNIK